MSIEFAGTTLPVMKDESGHDVVQLKPISDIFGLEWKRQLKKVQAESYARRLGTCIGASPYAGQARDMVCIRVDRVIAFLNMINPQSVRGSGNTLGADFLEAKQAEWDDVLHHYELRKGDLIKVSGAEMRNKTVTVNLYLKVLRAQGTAPDVQARQSLSKIAAQLAADAGAPYQQEMPGV
jgi:hypothetical protein